MSFIDIPTSHGLTQEQWEDKLYTEYLGQFPFSSLMGTSENAVIQVKDDLTKEVGDAITIGIMGELSGTGVTGNQRLKGNEENLEFFDQRITIDEFRHGVLKRGKMSQKRVAFSLRESAKTALKNWLKNKTENDLVNALSSTSSGRVTHRYLYGAAIANWNATHATALANVDSTNDQLSTSMISIAKRRARFGGAIRMRPMQIVGSDGKAVAEKFILMAHPNSVRDLLADSAWSNHQRDLVVSGLGNNVPIITGSDYVGEWDGVVVYSSDRVLVEAGAGAASIDVAHNLMLGAQAAAIVWGERTTWAEDIDDYDHDHGFKVGEIRGIEKLVFSRTTPEDHGVFHIFSSNVADS